MSTSEKLKAAAIERNGKVWTGARSHWEIRMSLGDDDPRMSAPGDVEGFVTTSGRFIDRNEARQIGVASGQLSPMWRDAARKLLSSDINW